MSSRKRNKIIEEFIEIYKSEPCLWRIKCKDYHDRALRDAAYAKLLAKLKESEPDAVKDTVVRKINNLRSNFRKEKKIGSLKEIWKWNGRFVQANAVVL